MEHYRAGVIAAAPLLRQSVCESPYVPYRVRRAGAQARRLDTPTEVTASESDLAGLTGVRTVRLKRNLLCKWDVHQPLLVRCGIYTEVVPETTVYHWRCGARSHAVPHATLFSRFYTR